MSGHRVIVFIKNCIHYQYKNVKLSHCLDLRPGIIKPEDALPPAKNINNLQGWLTSSGVVYHIL